jgi:hypothetical protein
VHVSYLVTASEYVLDVLVAAKDRHMLGILLVRITILLYAQVSNLCSLVIRVKAYKSIMSCELMLLLKCKVLVAEKDNTSLEVVSEAPDINLTSEQTSATSNANSSF